MSPGDWADALRDILDDEPLTKTASVPESVRRVGERAAWMRDGGASWESIASELGISVYRAKFASAAVGGEGDPVNRRGPRYPELVEQVCILRAEKHSFNQIADKLGISIGTVTHYVSIGAPELYFDPEIRKRGGAHLGRNAIATDAQLAKLHRLCTDHELSVARLSRAVWKRLGYGSDNSAKEAIRRAWKRLGLPLPELGSRCEAETRWGPNRGGRCKRRALMGKALCYMHDDQGIADRHAALMRSAPGAK